MTMKVLIVDDEPRIVQGVRKYFEQAGFDVKESTGFSSKPSGPSHRDWEIKGATPALEHRRRMDWNALLSTFGLIFVAELGDKTQLAVVTQTCKFRRPLAVFLGASLALAAVTVLGAIGGQWLGQIIPASALRFVAALAFVVMGALVGREAARAQSSEAGQDAVCTLGDESENEGDVDCAPASAWDWKAFSSTLGLLFVAELGDKTQLAVLSLAGKYGDTWSVFLGGTLALTLVTALGVLGGQGLCSLIPEHLLLWVSAAAFVMMGALIGFGVL